jgi:hypothetical protein
LSALLIQGRTVSSPPVVMLLGIMAIYLFGMVAIITGER